MASRLAKLKKNSAARLKALQEKAEAATSKKTFEQDKRFWQPTVDAKTGEGQAVIRFLNAPEGEDLDWAQLYVHSFKVRNKWYINNCPSTINLPSPVMEFVSPIWDSEDKAKIAAVRDMSRKMQFISNIYVVDDPEHPENNGKVFLFKYGKQIFKIVNDASKAVKGIDPINPYCIQNGANFSLVITRDEKKRRSYLTSRFARPEPLFEDEKEMEEVLAQCHSLTQFTAPDQFLPYDELKKKLERVLGYKVDGKAIKVGDDEEEAPKTSKTKSAPKQREAEEEDEEFDMDKALADALDD